MTHIDDDNRCPHCQQRLDAEQEIADLKAQLEEANVHAGFLADELSGMYEEMREEIARARDIGFEAGKRGGYY